MNKETKDAIREFAESLRISKFSTAILYMQEEACISDKCSFKNCFKALRNISAHEPGTFAREFSKERNRGVQRITISTDAGYMVLLDVVQLAAWLIDMALREREYAYIEFLYSTYKMLYPEQIVESTLEKPIVCSVDFMKDCVGEYYKLSNILYEQLGILKPIAEDDPYAVNLLKENPKIFWKLAVPDMLRFTCVFLSNFNLHSICNLEWFKFLYVAREGVATRGEDDD